MFLTHGPASIMVACHSEEKNETLPPMELSGFSIFIIFLHLDKMVLSVMIITHYVLDRWQWLRRDWDMIVTNTDSQIWEAICHYENIPFTSFWRLFLDLFLIHIAKNTTTTNESPSFHRKVINRCVNKTKGTVSAD